MRAPLLLPLSIALLSAFPALAQDAPRVLFCSGPCFAVDPNGARTPAPKGTTLRPNQRFETGSGAYAQLKLGSDAAMALGESARVRFEQLADGTVVNLDLGRLRMIRESIGKPTRPIELNTADGRFVLRDADVEIKKSQTASLGTNLTVVRVNAGEAFLRSAQGDIAVGKGDVQGIAGGKLIDQPLLKIPEPIIRPGDLAPASIATLPKGPKMLRETVFTADGPKTLDTAILDIARTLTTTSADTTISGTMTLKDAAAVTLSTGYIYDQTTIVKSPTGTETTAITPTLSTDTLNTSTLLTSTKTVTTTSTLTTSPTAITTTTLTPITTITPTFQR